MKFFLLIIILMVFFEEFNNLKGFTGIQRFGDSIRLVSHQVGVYWGQHHSFVRIGNRALS